MIKKSSMLDAMLKGRFSGLLVVIAFLFFVVPFFPPDMTFAGRVVDVVMLVLFIGCLRSISHSRTFFFFMVGFTLLYVAIGGYDIINHADTQGVTVMVLLLRIGYFVAVFFSIMHYVLDASPVTSDKICGAISAYMIMGIVWSFVYALFYQLDPSSLRIPEEMATAEGDHSWIFYYSFTTLTTLGYGDLVPVKPAVRSYAIMEAACGQVFLAVIVARLVALHIIHAKGE